MQTLFKLFPISGKKGRCSLGEQQIQCLDILDNDEMTKVWIFLFRHPKIEFAIFDFHFSSFALGYDIKRKIPLAIGILGYVVRRPQWTRVKNKQCIIWDFSCIRKILCTFQNNRGAISASWWISNLFQLLISQIRKSSARVNPSGTVRFSFLLPRPSPERS